MSKDNEGNEENAVKVRPCPSNEMCWACDGYDDECSKFWRHKDCNILLRIEASWTAFGVKSYGVTAVIEWFSRVVPETITHDVLIEHYSPATNQEFEEAARAKGDKM